MGACQSDSSGCLILGGESGFARWSLSRSPASSPWCPAVSRRTRACSIPSSETWPHETKTWQGVDASTYFDDIDDIEAALETEGATWANAAASFGATMHAEAQYARLVRRDYGDADGAIAADGWRYADTFEGSLDVAALSAASDVLARHTTTPDAGIAAIWDGWGGLVRSQGVSYLVFESTDVSSAGSTDGDDHDQRRADHEDHPVHRRIGDALNAPLAPANANRYEYAADNPINILDPTGECLLGDVFGGFFALLAGAAVVATGGLAIAEFGAGELIAGAAAAASGGPPAAGLSLASVFSFQAGC